MSFQLNELRGIYSFDKDWKTYLEGKEFEYSDHYSIRQVRKLFGFVECDDKDDPPMYSKSAQQKRETEIAEYCRKHGITFAPSEEIRYFEPEKIDNGKKTGVYRDVTIRRRGIFTLPADLSTELLHKICETSYDNLSGRFTGLSNRSSRSISIGDTAKKVAEAAVSMICGDIKLCTRDEYRMDLIVYPQDLRYDEPGGDIAGIIFANEGMPALRSMEEQKVFAAIVLEGIRKETKGSARVLDIHFEAIDRNDPRECGVKLLVMYKMVR